MRTKADDYHLMQDSIESEVNRLKTKYQAIAQLDYHKMPYFDDVGKTISARGNETCQEIIWVISTIDRWTTIGLYAYHKDPESKLYPICHRWDGQSQWDQLRGKVLFNPHATIEEKIDQLVQYFPPYNRTHFVPTSTPTSTPT